MGRRGAGAGSDARTVVTIDVAHPPLSSEEAERVLDEALRSAGLSGRTRLIRVIHGYGSRGIGGTLKVAVRNWAYRRRGKSVTVVAGEEYSPFLPEVQEFLKSAEGVGMRELSDVNEGMTLVFLA